MNSPLERLIKFQAIRGILTNCQTIKMFWEVCQIPDFRNLGPEAHGRLLETIFTNLMDNSGKFSNVFLEKNIMRLDYIEGSIEILASRLSFIRTWAFIAHKKKWTQDGDMWINLTKSVEENLSTALHNKLIARFVDRRTSALLKGIGAKSPMDAVINNAGEIHIDGHSIGHIKGLLYTPADTYGDLDAKAVHTAALIALAPEIDRRLMQITGCEQAALTLSDQGDIIWNSDIVGKLAIGETLLTPNVELIGGDLGSAVLREQALGRINDFIKIEATQKFEALLSLKTFCDDPNSFQGARPLAHNCLKITAWRCGLNIYP